MLEDSERGSIEGLRVSGRWRGRGLIIMLLGMNRDKYGRLIKAVKELMESM